MSCWEGALTDTLMWAECSAAPNRPPSAVMYNTDIHYPPCRDPRQLRAFPDFRRNRVVIKAPCCRQTLQDTPAFIGVSPGGSWELVLISVCKAQNIPACMWEGSRFHSSAQQKDGDSYLFKGIDFPPSRRFIFFIQLEYICTDWRRSLTSVIHHAALFQPPWALVVLQRHEKLGGSLDPEVIGEKQKVGL